MSGKITAIENNDLFTELSLDEEESLCGGKSFWGKVWEKVKEVGVQIGVALIIREID